MIINFGSLEVYCFYSVVDECFKYCIEDGIQRSCKSLDEAIAAIKTEVSELINEFPDCCMSEASRGRVMLNLFPDVF